MEQDKNEIELKQQNEELIHKLQQYKSLEEDLMASRVFEKAKKQLTTYITLGGIIILISGVIGIKSLADYAKNLAKDKMEALPRSKSKRLYKKKGNGRLLFSCSGSRMSLSNLQDNRVRELKWQHNLSVRRKHRKRLFLPVVYWTIRTVCCQ
jgi:hypothetical protein